MRRFEQMNPITTAFYYLCVLGVTMFSMQPVILCISLFSSVLCGVFDRSAGRRAHIFSAVLFIIAAVINPIAVHNGSTVLFYLNDRPFTLEAVVYGIAAACMITASLYWLRSLSKAMTSDKVMYIFGRFSPKTALIISMSIRYIGLFRLRWRKIQDSQRALGLYDDGNLIDAVRGRARVLSILITWTLENGIVTAESMEARGYGGMRRTSYSDHRIHTADVALMAVFTILTAFTVAGLTNTSAVYYPDLRFYLFTPWGIVGAAAFFALCLLPPLINLKEAIRWRILTSKI